MKLPKLKVLPDDPAREPVHCKEHDYCSECALYVNNGGRCEGCTPQHRESLRQEFRWCYQNCNTCTGYKTELTAICCRSPLKKMYLDAVTGNPDNWNEPVFQYTKRDVIKFDRKAIFYFNYGSAMQVTGGGKRRLVDHEVVAVNLSSVKALGKGFFSNDMHDYLCLDKKKTKLLLTTMSIDDHLDRAWEDGFFEKPEEIEKVGFSYWSAPAFTMFGDAARMYQYYQFCKIHRSAGTMQSHFIPGHNLKGIRFDDLILRAVENVPQVMFNTQWLNNDEARLKEYLTRFQRWHKLVPKNVAFWFVGAVTPTFIANTRRICEKRDLYFVAGKPLYLAVHGKRLRADGTERKLEVHERPDKLDLIHENYTVFENLVNTYGRRK